MAAMRGDDDAAHNKSHVTRHTSHVTCHAKSRAFFEHCDAAVGGAEIDSDDGVVLIPREFFFVLGDYFFIFFATATATFLSSRGIGNCSGSYEQCDQHQRAHGAQLHRVGMSVTGATRTHTSSFCTIVM